MAQQLEDIRRMLGTLQRDMAELASRLGRVEARMSVIAVNRREPLLPLRALATAEEIPGFPRTPQDIDGMDGKANNLSIELVRAGGLTDPTRFPIVACSKYAHGGNRRSRCERQLIHTSLVPPGTRVLYPLKVTAYGENCFWIMPSIDLGGGL
ncbi:hypothetical protein MAPG_09555 [Magnaporthiopsis poae ATCC 64411]|uniref:Uncharacterized protein n=1 Tax=Magnaporthiopsis poae (strain ATCC 64411 / 73-15) TaxID=644358 RepID=A0A0C4EA96_MAGP6|nr:hypothetical protein MAPG_09555 [Magnaporthiopsis poae ATCC 64411]